MNSLKTTSKILLVVAALSMAAVGCERRAGESYGTSGSTGTSSSGTGSSGSSYGGGSSGGSSGTGTSGTGGSTTGK